ncbi:MAG TPA: hypothetical protein VGL66_16055 [Caulobacteraceae bacterium]|jgi:hypothetical protein
MAEVARATSLAVVFGEGGPQFGPQIWLDPQLGLVAGVFPNAASRFDFGLEAAQILNVNTAGETKIVAKPPKVRVSLVSEAPRFVRFHEIETVDAIYGLASMTQTLVRGLDLIEGMKPGTLEKLSNQKKRSKRPVARSRIDLYDVEHSESHSEKLANGWFVATNNKATEAMSVLKRAASLADLKWGVDFTARES